MIRGLDLLRKILFVCFLGLFAFAESFEDIKDLEFAPKKNLKILILDEDMQIREVVDIDSKVTDNITLKLDKKQTSLNFTTVQYPNLPIPAIIV